MSDRFKITLDEATSILADGDYLHTFANPGPGMLFGADWSRQDVLNQLAVNVLADVPLILAGPNMANMGHGLCIDPKRRLFVATDEKRLAALEAAIALEPSDV